MKTQASSKPGIRRAIFVIFVIVAILIAWSLPGRFSKDASPAEPGSVAELKSPAKSAPEPLAERSTSSHLWRDTVGSTQQTGFHGWVERYFSTIPAHRPSMIEEGVKLATERRTWLRKEVEADPALAFRAAIPEEIRNQLPAAIRKHLEARVNSTGFLNVDISCGHADHDHHQDHEHHCGSAEFHRQIHVDGVSYEAVALGTAEDLPSQPLDVNGVALPADDASSAPLMVFSPWSARIVEPAAPAEGPVTVERAGKRSVYPSLAAALENETGLPPGGWDEVAYAGPDLREPTATSPMPNGNSGASGSADPTMSKGINRRCIIVRHTFSGRPGFISDANILTGYEGFRTVQNRTSWGQNTYAPASTTLNATDTWVPPPLAMPGTWSQYDTGARDIIRESYDLLRPQLLAAGLDFDDFSHFILAYDHPGLIPTNASGLATYGPWFPGYPGFPAGARLGLARIWAKEDANHNKFIMLHECGHNLRQLHAHKWSTDNRSVIGSGYSTEYSDPYDSMAAANNDRGYNSAARLWLGYLPAADAPLLSATGTTTTKVYTIDENPTTPQIRALRVQHSIDTSQCYWIEHRDAVGGGTQSDELKNSVFIRRGGINGLEAWWLDWRAPKLGANHLYVGHTFSDRTANLYITPVGQTGDTTTPAVDVVVTRGPILGNRPPVVNLSASNTNPARNASITLTATSTDPDGDTLAYGWDFGDGKLSWNNSAVQTKSFSANGDFVVQCRVSDMKGGETRQSVVIRVGSPTTRRISGTVYLPEGPIGGIRVDAGSEYALTDSNGNFTLTGLADGAQTLTARDPIHDLYTFTDQTVTLSGSNISGLTFFSDTPGAPQVGLRGQYYTGTNFNTLSLTRRDLRVDFDWGLGSPASVLPVDGFSSRWTGRILAKRSGVHQFHLLADEGARLYIDGVLVINQWNSTTETTHTGLAALRAGTYHEIKIETKDTTGPAKARFSWTQPGESVAAVVPDHSLWGAVNGVVAEYFTDKNLTPSTLKQSRLETTAIDRNYDSIAPDVPGMSRTNFSVRWSGRLKASATGTFTFHTDSDEGVRLWVNGTQIINDWTTRALAERTGTISLTSGQVYDLVLEYFQGTGDASVKLSWTPPGGTKTVIPISAFTPAERSTNLYAEFWQNKDLSGDPALTRWDDDIDFSWTGAPDENIPADNWSARWTGRIKTGVAGSYAIQTANDDGVRVWIDGTQVINNWVNGNNTSNGTITLAADTWYDLKLEYYDAASTATVRLRWKPPGTSSFVVVPAANVALWGGNSAPYVGPLTNHSLTTGQTLVVTPVGQDAESPTLAWSLAPGAPTGATIDPFTGVFTWTPDASAVGSNTITIIATDSGTPALSAQSSFQVDVAFPYLWDANTATANAQDGAGNWNTSSANWWFGSGNVVWDPSRTAEIGAAGSPGNITLQSSLTAAGLRFRPAITTARAYSIIPGSGSPVLSIASGGIIELDDLSNSSTSTISISISANLAANNLVITKANTGSNGFLGFSGSNSGLTGTLTLNGTNGGILLTAGSAGALGTAEVTVESGSTLDVNSSATFDNNLDLGGTGLGGRGALRVFNNINATFTGNIGLTATTRIQTESGATGTITGTISGNFGIDKTSSGTLILGGENTFTGSSNISGGVLRLTDGSGLGTSTAGTTINSGATLQLTGGITCPEPLTLQGNTAANATRVVNMSGNNTLAGNISPTSGGTFHGLRSDAGKLTVTGNIASIVSGDRAFYLRGTSDGEITGGYNKGNASTATLFKEGTGTWILSGTSSFNGQTTISAGTLQIGNGGTTGRLTATSAITNNASLVINRSDDFTQATDLGAAAIISGTGSLTHAGTGTTTLTAINTYSGDTNVTAGTLSLGQVNPSNESSTVRIATDATLDLAFTGTDVVDKLFIAGIQQPAGNYTADHPSAVFTGPGTLQVTSGTPGFPLWIASTGLAGPDAAANADPDHDGLPNLIEFILGGQPNPANPSADSSDLAPTITLETSYLVFTYRRSDLASSAPGISIRVEHGSSLTSWNEAIHGQNGVIITTSDDGFAPGIDRVEVRIPRPGPGSPPWFARLTASTPN